TNGLSRRRARPFQNLSLRNDVSIGLSMKGSCCTESSRSIVLAKSSIIICSLITSLSSSHDRQLRHFLCSPQCCQSVSTNSPHPTTEATWLQFTYIQMANSLMTTCSCANEQNRKRVGLISAPSLSRSSVSE